MKKIVIAILSIVISTVGFSQLTTNLLLSPTPPGTITDWNHRREVFSYVVINQSGAVSRAVIKAELRTAGGELVASTNLAQATIYTFSSASTFLDAVDVLALQHMIFVGKFKNILDRTGKLRADNYQLCVQLVTPVSFAPITQPVCRNFTIASIQLPVLMMPADGSTLDAIKSQAAIIFRWTPVSPSQQQPVLYRIQVFEILNHQTPMQAFKSNLPLLNKEIIGGTQFIWQPQMDLTITCCDGEEIVKDSIQKNEKTNYTRRFTWTVQSFDLQRRPLNDGNVNGDARSEPAVFFVNLNTQSALKKEKDQ
jgi:hypothetical protein